MKKNIGPFLLLFSFLSNEGLHAQGSCASPDGSFIGYTGVYQATYASANGNGWCYNNLVAGQTYCWTYFYPSSGNFRLQFITNETCGSCGANLSLNTTACSGGCSSVGAVGCGAIQYNSACVIQDGTGNIEHGGSGSCTPAQTCGTIFTMCITVPVACVTMDVCPMVYCVNGPANCIGVLPIELISFTGKNECEKNILSWSSATETNNDYYTIERGTIAEGTESGEMQWETAGTVDGAGNSSLPLEYEFVDEAPALKGGNNSINSPSGVGGVIYYRLKQTDFDGKSETFHTIALKKDCGSELVITPTLTEDEVVIRFGNDHSWNTVSLFDSMGRKIISSSISKELGETKVNLSQYAKGLYTVVVSSALESVTKKVILQ